MPTVLQWRSFYVLVYGPKGREATIIPIPLSAEWVRVEITILTFPVPAWYRAGWINQVLSVQGKPYIQPGQVVPLAHSVFRFSNDQTYQVKFKPVPYLPQALVKFYRSI